MSDDKEREDLDALTRAPGWLRFRNALLKEWESGRFDDYVQAAVLGSRDVTQEMVKLASARAAILAALKYPEERIRQLDTAAKERTLESAGGSLARGGIR